MAEHNEIGKAGEQAAACLLQEKGYIIRHRNWRSGRKELDIVAENEDFLVVVEVKTRSTSTFEYPEKAVSALKIRRLIHATDAYIRYFHINKEVRFDVISIIGEPGNFTIEHIEDSFLPPSN